VRILYSRQYRLYLSEYMPPSGFLHVVRYAIDLFKTAEPNQFLNKLLPYILRNVNKIDWNAAT